MSLDAQSPKSVPNADEIPPTNPRRTRRKPAEDQVSRDTSLLPTPPADGAPKLEWALWWAEIGRLTGAVKVFLCGDDNKVPLRKGWQAEASNDPETIKAWWAEYPNANIGLAIQPGFVAIDIDQYKPGAKEKLEAFEAEHGKLPQTLEGSTARGGRHLVFATSKIFGSSSGTLPDCVDVKGHGGYIMGSGSTFEGKPYTLKRVIPPIDCPEHVEAMLTETKRRDRSKHGTPPIARGVMIDHPRNEAFFAAWLAGKSNQTLTTPDGEVAEAGAARGKAVVHGQGD